MPRAFLHAPGHAFFHKAQFFGGGRPVLHAHDVEAHGAEPHIGTQVDARLRGVERIEIGGEPVPAPRFLGYAVEPGNARAPRLLVPVADGGHRHAVEAYVLCGNPLHDFGQGQRLIYYPQIRMAVAVDEAGAQDVASDVEHRPGFGHIVGRTHGHDAPVAHADAAFAPGVARPVHDAGVGQEQIQHERLSLSAEHDAARQLVVLFRDEGDARFLSRFAVGGADVRAVDVLDAELAGPGHVVLEPRAEPVAHRPHAMAP